MPNEKWSDDLLDERFTSVEAQLRVLRDVPARVATFDIRLANVDEHLRSVAGDLRHAADKADETTQELGAIKVEQAKLATTMRLWATLGGILGAGIVSGVIAVLPHS